MPEVWQTALYDGKKLCCARWIMEHTLDKSGRMVVVASLTISWDNGLEEEIIYTSRKIVVHTSKSNLIVQAFRTLEDEAKTTLRVFAEMGV